jgi:hypothetical protein
MDGVKVAPGMSRINAEIKKQGGPENPALMFEAASAS